MVSPLLSQTVTAPRVAGKYDEFPTLKEPHHVWFQASGALSRMTSLDADERREEATHVEGGSKKTDSVWLVGTLPKPPSLAPATH